MPLKFFIILSLIALFSLQHKPAFAQKDTSDYFAIGIFGGMYNGKDPIRDNKFPNAIAIEAEYYKFTDLSFYLSGLYEFTRSNKTYRPETEPTESRQKTYRINISFGGRYYLRSKQVNPFVEAGINQEINYLGRYHSVHTRVNDGHEIIHASGSQYIHRMTLNIGAGISFKLSHKFKIEMKYDLYGSVTNSYDPFTAFSFLAGVKYNL